MTTDIEKYVPRKMRRPKKTISTTEQIETGCGHLYVTIGRNKETDELVEVFAILGKAGGCAMAQNEAITRMISLAIKYYIPIDEIVKELGNIRCSCHAYEEGEPIVSCADAIAYALAKEIKEKEGENNG